MLIDRLTRQGNLQGLLRMAVGGLQAVMRRGSFSLPASVTNATERFKLEADPMRAYIDECVIAGKAFTPRNELYLRYVAWTTSNGFHQMSTARFYESFGAALVDSGLMATAVTMHGVRGYRGIELA